MHGMAAEKNWEKLRTYTQTMNNAFLSEANRSKKLPVHVAVARGADLATVRPMFERYPLSDALRDDRRPTRSYRKSRSSR